MKKTILILMTCASLSAFDFGLTWDWSPNWTAQDSFDTTNSVFANLKGFNLYRGDTVTNFVLFQSVGPTNLVRLTNQPQAGAFYFVKSVGVDGNEDSDPPKGTNHVIPPQPVASPSGLKASR